MKRKEQTIKDQVMIIRYTQDDVGMTTKDKYEFIPFYKDSLAYALDSIKYDLAPMSLHAQRLGNAINSLFKRKEE